MTGLIHFFVSGEDKQVFPGSQLWETPLAGRKNKKPGGIFSGNAAQNPGITIGDYFSAAGIFLSENEFLTVRTGLESVLNSPVPAFQIDRVDVFLEKHGAFYHPLKIAVTLDGSRSCAFVLNGAVSKAGLSLIEKEYHLISKLNTTFPKQYLPRVFGVDILETDTGRFGFFLGEWFEGYKEFHATRDHGKRQVVLWASDGNCRYMHESEAFPIYGEISRILTCYYDIETFDQICPWHHAAGDFIVQQKNGRADVRLITVRGYAPVTEFAVPSTDRATALLPSLLLFFLNLTLRIRLDRLNGTGPVVMLGEEVIKAVVDGFLLALDEKSQQDDHGDLRSVFISFFTAFSPAQVTELMETTLESWYPEPSEIAVIEKNLASHCALLHALFKSR